MKPVGMFVKQVDNLGLELCTKTPAYHALTKVRRILCVESSVEHDEDELNQASSLQQRSVS